MFTPSRKVLPDPRLINAFSKKIENHAHSVALFAMCYNFVCIHKTLRTSPAMAEKVTERLLEISDIVDVLETGKWPLKGRQHDVALGSVRQGRMP